RTQNQLLSGDFRRSSGTAVQTFTRIDDDGVAQTTFGGVTLSASFEDSKLTGKDFEKHVIDPLNNAFDLGLEPPLRAGDGGNRRVDLGIELTEQDLEQLKTLSDAEIRAAASQVGARPQRLIALRNDLASLQGPAEAGLRLQAYVKAAGFRGLSAVVNALDAKDRLKIDTTSTTYTDAIKESHRLRTYFSEPVDPDASSADLRLRFNASYAAVKQIDVATQELRDDDLLRKHQPEEFERRMTELESARMQILERTSLEHLTPEQRQTVFEKTGTPKLLFAADAMLAKYPDPIDADATKAELKARFKEVEKVLFNLDAKIKRIEEGDARWLKPPFVANNYAPVDPEAETQRLVELRNKRTEIESLLSVDQLSAAQREAMRRRESTT
ncbi:MAG: hypothetical protein AAFV29_24080, partial [Myxococcota bacterium]